jgi:hypothetical protein
VQPAGELGVLGQQPQQRLGGAGPGVAAQPVQYIDLGVDRAEELARPQHHVGGEVLGQQGAEVVEHLRVDPACLPQHRGQALGLVEVGNPSRQHRSQCSTGQ